MAWRRYLAFDLDGTLIDSAPDIAAALNAFLAELGAKPLPFAAIRAMIGDGTPVLLARGLKAAGIDRKAEELIGRFRKIYDAEAIRRTKLYPGVAATLAALKGEKRRLCICTNKPVAATRLVLGHLGIGAIFDSVIGGDSLPQRKPAKEPLLAAIRGAGGDPALAPDEAVMIGDSDNDLICADAAGLPAIIIPSGYGRPAVAPAIAIAAFADLPAALAQLDQN
jgi:phosphoglycolate phosphatase